MASVKDLNSGGLSIGGSDPKKTLESVLRHDIREDESKVFIVNFIQCVE